MATGHGDKGGGRRRRRHETNARRDAAARLSTLKSLVKKHLRRFVINNGRLVNSGHCNIIVLLFVFFFFFFLSCYWSCYRVRLFPRFIPRAPISTISGLMWIKVAIHCTALPDATSATAAAAAAAAAAVAGDVICPLICPFSIPECFFFGSVWRIGFNSVACSIYLNPQVISRWFQNFSSADT